MLNLKPNEWEKIRGRDIRFIFQEAKKALDPISTIGAHLSEAIIQALGCTKKEAKEESHAILHKVGLPDTARILKSYSYELSGGMAQRAMIAMAISGNPKLIIADEPTSALDVSIQGQILRLLRDLRDSYNSAMLLITHDLGVAATNCDRVAVMYAGSIVEYGPVETIFSYPSHPYTRKLLAALPRPDSVKLEAIPGTVPDLIHPPSGCRFSNRCDRATEQCFRLAPPQQQSAHGHDVACFNPENMDVMPGVGEVHS